MKCPIVERTLSVTTRWVILLVIAGASTVCVADPIVFTNGDASHIVNGQAINSVREGSRFTLAGTTSLTSMDFNFVTSATTRMDSVDWWIYSADPETLVSPTAQGTASVGSVFLGNVLVGNSYADYTGTIALPGIPLAAGTYYVVLGDATKAGISVTTYWADDSTSSGASVFWESTPAPDGTWQHRTADYIFDLRGTASVPEPATGMLLVSALPLGFRRRRARTHNCQ